MRDGSRFNTRNAGNTMSSLPYHPTAGSTENEKRKKAHTCSKLRMVIDSNFFKAWTIPRAVIPSKKEFKSTSVCFDDRAINFRIRHTFPQRNLMRPFLARLPA
eukprot:540436-Pelagomonas_calceolata.AAC.4